MKRLLAILVVLAGMSGAAQPSGNDLFQQALSKERAEGKLDEAIRVYERNERLRRSSVDPDGRRLAFVGGAVKFELWAIEHLLSSASAGTLPSR